MSQNKSTQRCLISDLLAAACEKYDEWASLDNTKKATIVRQIERSCLNYSVEQCTLKGVECSFANPSFTSAYSAVCHKVLANLDPTTSVGSTYLIQSLITGHINANNVATMSSADLCPSANASERREVETRMAQKIKQRVSTAYTCRKCGTKESILIEYQSRCADEASTISAKCVRCRNVWHV